MQRKFLSNLAFLILVNLLIKPFWIFGIDRTVQNTVGSGEYGLYFAVFNFSFLFSMLLDFGVNNFNNRAVARHESLLEKLLPNMFAVKGMLGVLYVLVTVVCALALDFDSKQLHLLLFLVLNQILVSFILYFRSNISALHLFRLDAVLSVMDKALMILVVGVLLWGNVSSGPFRIEWLVYSQTAAYATTSILAFLLVLSKAGGISLKWNPATFKRILRLSFPFALLGILMSIYHRIDAVMIERMLGTEGAEQAGIYAASYRIVEAFTMIGFAFATILLPMFARMLKRKESVTRLISLATRSMLFVVTVVVAGCYFYREPIMDLLYLEASPYWAEIFGLLVISFVGTATGYIFGTLLTANGNLWHLNAMAISSVALNIVLNALLIPQYQALGATVATLVTQLSAAAVQIVMCFVIFRFRVNLQQSARALLFVLAGCALFWGGLQLNMDWLVSFIGAGALCVVLAALLNIIDLKELRKELRPAQI